MTANVGPRQFYKPGLYGIVANRRIHKSAYTLNREHVLAVVDRSNPPLSERECLAQAKHDLGIGLDAKQG